MSGRGLDGRDECRVPFGRLGQVRVSGFHIKHCVSCHVTFAFKDRGDVCTVGLCVNRGYLSGGARVRPVVGWDGMGRAQECWHISRVCLLR